MTVTLVAVAAVAIVARWWWLGREDRTQARPAELPPCRCEWCVSLTADEEAIKAAEQVVLAAYLDWRIEQTLEGDL